MAMAIGDGVAAGCVSAAGECPPTALRTECPVCALSAAAPYPGVAPFPWKLAQCQACELVYLENPPASDQLCEELAWERQVAQTTAERRAREPWLHRVGSIARVWKRRLKFRKPLALLRRYASAGRVLDIGCGRGRLLAALEPRHEPHGIEISRQLAAAAGKLLSGRGEVVHADALTGLAQQADESCAAVLMLAYLEHETSPRDVCREVERVLMHGGIAIAKVPNHDSWLRQMRGARWCGYRFPDHVNYFTPKSLMRLFAASGLALVRSTRLDRWPLGDNFWMVVRKP